MPPAIRSLLFVSGEKSDRFPKALAVGADLVCIDLEDAVSPACKQQAREGDQLKLEGIKVLDLSQFLPGPFWPAVVERLGIGDAQMKAINPGIMYCSIVVFGQTGPYAQRPAHDVSLEAESSLLSLNLGGDGARQSLPARGGHGRFADGDERSPDGTVASQGRRSRRPHRHLDAASLVSWLVNVVGPMFSQDHPPLPRDERSRRPAAGLLGGVSWPTGCVLGAGERPARGFAEPAVGPPIEALVIAR